MTTPYPQQCRADDERLPAVLSLIQSTFAYMENRVDPPSSMTRLTVNDIATQCETGEVWVIGTPMQACIFLKKMDGRLYMGKLAVDPGARGKGFARRLVELAEERALAQHLQELELEVRIELVENHKTFGALGFQKVSEGAHYGYDRITFITMRKHLS